MAAMVLLISLAVDEICLVQEPQDNYTYAVLGVDVSLLDPTSCASCTSKRMMCSQPSWCKQTHSQMRKNFKLAYACYCVY